MTTMTRAVLQGLALLVCLTARVHYAAASRVRRSAELGRGDVPMTRGLRRAHSFEKRCIGTLGTWCTAYLSQEPIPAKAPPHGNKTCLNDCTNGAGVCNHDTGLCDCLAGYTGDYCQFLQKRPCTQRHRGKGLEPESFSDWQLEGWTNSRCAGTCDDARAACYCSGRFGRVEADTFADPRAPPKQPGRPMPMHCTIALLKNGTRIPYLSGDVTWDDIFGPEGWCEADEPRHTCPCMLDGRAGRLCEIFTEHFCVNQCSGHGECRMGFCLCHEGYYGHDCARRRAGAEEVPGDEVERKWLAEALVQPPAAADPPLSSKRLRPLIYVYDLPAQYNSRMLEYRMDKGTCVHRLWSDHNTTYLQDNTYNIETLLHEALLQSPHRTLDAEEADFFYVPLYSSCYVYPVMGSADFPWYYGPGGIRVNQGALMALEAKRWIENHLPWWNRRGGADHIWLFPHDEGPCWAPREIWDASIIFSHWGRLDPHPRSNSAYWQDNYTHSEENPWHKKGYKDVIGDHPCYDPKRHLVIPAVKNPQGIGRSPMLGQDPLPRDFLLFFRGDFRSNYTPHYSRGIRQKLRELSRQHDWEKQYKIIIGTHEDYPGAYDEWLMKSKFCLVVPGDGWSPRAEDAILHGCVPLVIMDDVVPVFGTILDWDQFSIRVKEADLEKVPEILLAVTPEELHAFQRMLPHVWKRFLYSSYKLHSRFLPKPRHPVRVRDPATLPLSDGNASSDPYQIHEVEPEVEPDVEADPSTPAADQRRADSLHQRPVSKAEPQLQRVLPATGGGDEEGRSEGSAGAAFLTRASTGSGAGSGHGTDGGAEAISLESTAVRAREIAAGALGSESPGTDPEARPAPVSGGSFSASEASSGVNPTTPDANADKSAFDEIPRPEAVPQRDQETAGTPAATPPSRLPLASAVFPTHNQLVADPTGPSLRLVEGTGKVIPLHAMPVPRLPLPGESDAMLTTLPDSRGPNDGNPETIAKFSKQQHSAGMLDGTMSNDANDLMRHLGARGLRAVPAVPGDRKRVLDASGQGRTGRPADGAALLRSPGSSRRLSEAVPQETLDRAGGAEPERRTTTHARIRIHGRSGGGGSARPTYASLPGPYHGDLTKDDAIATIMAWLYSRIPDLQEH